ncbi:hypothetical protein CPB83DRAFT_865808 [Crepidotus variabilis]|uniref:RBR-type E3 ubiquitin transferase n=1 Tax=Crepidotus variabilis TaxID=179855 RepID=A0A9P6JWU2_9AGAR|nr:hypothetical protein CPB83DRAFT_865808 [Crepidotus variabilis]
MTLSAEDLELCQTMQKEEYEVLESIYPEYVSSQSLDGTLKLEIPVEFATAKSVLVSEPLPQASAEALRRKPTVLTVSLTILPPILLQINLPASYPLQLPPEILSVRATHVWLSDVGALQQALSELWQAGEPVLYTWVEHIRTGDFLEKLKLLSSTNNDILILPHPAPQVIVPLLQAFEKSSQSSQFATQSYPCSVCLTSLKGSKCLQLHCKHIFCRSCLEDFWKMCIEEGDVDRVGCPDPECVKKKTEASEEEVARIVTEAELDRWRWLREKRAYEKVCQTPVPKPKDVDANSDIGWNRLRQCPRCMFSFCAFCKRTWHGPLESCPIAQYEDVALAYLDAPENSEKREFMERKYGKTNIRKMVAVYQEEKANLEYLQASATMCPGCRCFVEKNMGCNHMTCWKCSQHFCFRCGDRLNPDKPYAHFSMPTNPCFNQLFDLDENGQPEDDWVDMDVGEI